MSRSARAVEIDGDDAAWLRGRGLPEGCEIAELDEVEFFGAVYDRAPGSMLYVPTADDPVDRALSRALDRAEEPPSPIGIDLFSGCGGFSLGMHEGGFDVVAAVEWDFAAAITYLNNLGHPDCRVMFAGDSDRARWEKQVSRAKSGKSAHWPAFTGAWIGSAYRASSSMRGGCRSFMFGDISKVSGAQLMEGAGVDAVDVVFGGPPCQGLSTSNTKACLEDPRNGMIWEYLRLVAELRPKSFIIENVPAILTVAKGALFNAIAELANDAGYEVVAQKLDAAGYGVPQHRVRAIIVGTRSDCGTFTYPMPTHWAIGRPVDERGWEMVDEKRYQKRLPAQAHFDRESRRWSFANPPSIDSEVQSVAASVRGMIEQLDCMEGAT